MRGGLLLIVLGCLVLSILFHGNVVVIFRFLIEMWLHIKIQCPRLLHMVKVTLKSDKILYDCVGVVCCGVM